MREARPTTMILDGVGSMGRRSCNIAKSEVLQLFEYYLVASLYL
jgi:hypothetical protein